MFYIYIYAIRLFSYGTILFELDVHTLYIYAFYVGFIQKYFMVTKETIIILIASIQIRSEKSKFWCLLFFFDFLATFGREMDVATTRSSNSPGFQSQPKSFLTEWTFSANRYLEILFPNFQA